MSASSDKPNLDLSAAAGLEGWVQHGFYPGAGLIVGSREGVLFERYFGAHGVETQVYIASSSKWLSAAVIAAVVDQGLLDWGATVGRWLPEFTGKAGEITLRQLLSHTSGMADMQPCDRHPDGYQTLAESVAEIAPLPLAHRPGERFFYGSLAFQVAGRMAELATQQPFEELFQRVLARPLGLRRTCFTPVDSAPGHNPMLGSIA